MGESGNDDGFHYSQLGVRDSRRVYSSIAAQVPGGVPPLCDASLGEGRNSRIITLIPRQEAIGSLYTPFSRYLDADDSEQVLEAVRLAPEDMPVDLFLHTPGGLQLAAEQIAEALIRHKARVIVFIARYAMLGGTLLVLAAHEIVMDRNAAWGRSIRRSANTERSLS